MFTRDQTAHETSEPVDVPAPQARPDMSTFAARKADQQAAGPRGPNIVSLGTDKKLLKDRRNHDVWLDVELAVDWNNRNHRYYRMPGDTVWIPLFDTSTTPNQSVEPLGVIDKTQRFMTTSYRPAAEESTRPLSEMG